MCTMASSSTSTAGRNPRLKSGDTFDVIKSAIQKYCRRGMEAEAVWCILEIYFSTIGNGYSYEKSTKALLTNLTNRLKIILCEDVSFKEVENSIRAISLLDQFQSSRATDIQSLIKATKIITKCKKSRICSHVWSACEDDAAQRAHDSKPVADVIVSRFERIRDETFYNIVYDIMVDLVANYKYKYPERTATNKKSMWEPFWSSCITCCEGYDSVQWVINRKRAFFNSRPFFPDERIVLTSAALLATYCQYYTVETPFFWPADGELISEEYYELDPIAHRSIIHPDFVYDRHTIIGRKRKRIDFATDGALITNPDLTLADDPWSDVYIAKKKELDDIEEMKRCKRKKSEAPMLFKHISKEMESHLPTLNVAWLNRSVIVGNSSKSKLFFFQTSEDNESVFADIGTHLVAKFMNANPFRYGRDQACVQKIKEYLKLNTYKGQRFKCFFRYEDNHTFVPQKTKNMLYVMSEIKGHPVPCSHSESKAAIIISPRLQIQVAEIIVMRLILGITDNNLTNMLLTDDGKIYSIDENRIGARDLIETGLVKLEQYVIDFLIRKCNFGKLDFKGCISRIYNAKTIIHIKKLMHDYGLYSDDLPDIYNTVKSNAYCVDELICSRYLLSQ